MQNNQDGTFSEQILDEYTRGFDDITIAIGRENLTTDDRIKKLYQAEEHFMKYLAESWELFVGSSMKEVMDYAKNYTKPFLCPKQYVIDLKQSVNSDIEFFAKRLKEIRSSKVVSRDLMWEVVDELKIMYDDFHDISKSITDKTYLPLVKIHDIIQARQPKFSLIVGVVGIIIAVVSLSLTIIISLL